MAKCAACQTTILFGGTGARDLGFCSGGCLQRGTTLSYLSRVPESVVQQQIWAVHQGSCPRCRGRGPVDVRKSYRVWSALVVTQWMTRLNLCCQPCGTSARLKDSVFCLFLGWWGFPWGLIMTPVQIFRNVSNMFSTADPSRPSAELTRFVALQLASRLAAQESGVAISADETSLWTDKKTGHV